MNKSLCLCYSFYYLPFLCGRVQTQWNFQPKSMYKSSSTMWKILPITTLFSGSPNYVIHENKILSVGKIFPYRQILTSTNLELRNSEANVWFTAGGAAGGAECRWKALANPPSLSSAVGFASLPLRWRAMETRRINEPVTKDLGNKFDIKAIILDSSGINAQLLFSLCPKINGYVLQLRSDDMTDCQKYLTSYCKPCIIFQQNIFYVVVDWRNRSLVLLAKWPN